MSLKLHCDFCDKIIPNSFDYNRGFFKLVKYKLFPVNFDKKDECIICQDCLKKILDVKENL